VITLNAKFWPISPLIIEFNPLPIVVIKTTPCGLANEYTGNISFY
jgi:hypothetical protein